MIVNRACALCLILVVALIWPTVSYTKKFTWSSRDELLYSDLVLHGAIEKLETGWTSINDYAPGISTDDNPNFRITILTLRIIDVLSGFHDGPRIEAILPGGFPGDSNNVGLSYNYAAGDEVVICFIYSPAMRAGSFIVRTDKGCFIIKDGVGRCQSPEGTDLTIDEIRDIALEGSLQRVVQQAEIIGVGDVLKITKPIDYTTDGISKSIEYVTVRVDSILKGQYENEYLDLKIIRTGFFVTPWREWVPKVNEFETWLFMLKKDGKEFYPFAGSNGLFKLADGKVIYNNRVEHQFSRVRLLSELEKLVRSQ